MVVIPMKNRVLGHHGRYPYEKAEFGEGLNVTLPIFKNHYFLNSYIPYVFLSASMGFYCFFLVLL